MNQTLFEWLSIDLGRLNVVGWLLILFTLGIMFGVPFFVFDFRDPNLNLNKEPWKIKAVGLGVIFLGVGFFYGARWLLERTGIAVYRPAKNS